jgi:predicted RNase H-like nuclease
VDGRQRAFEFYGLAQFLQCHVRLLAQQGSQLATMTSDNEGLAPRAMVARTNLAGSSALLQKLFHHAQRNPVSIRDFLAATLLIVVGSQNPFTQIKR